VSRGRRVGVVVVQGDGAGSVRECGRVPGERGRGCDREDDGGPRRALRVSGPSK